MKRRSTAPGFTVIIAIFLVIVLAALGAAAVTLSKTEQISGAKSLAASRVYYGAKAGLEWGIQQAVSSAASCTASTNFNLTQGALNGINVTVTCARSTQGFAGFSVYYLTSCATTGTTCAAPGAAFAGPGYAERRLEATVSNIP